MYRTLLALPILLLLCLISYGMNRISIVIDDMGNNLNAGKLIAELPGPVTCSIMPFRPFAKILATYCHNHLKPVIVHVPMQADDGADMGAGGLSVTMSRAQINTTLRHDIDSIPFRVGINNHMGSRLTADNAAMDAVMQTLKSLKLFYLDSMTSPKSIAEKVALENKVPTNNRDIFLDDNLNTGYISTQFQALIRRAKEKGYAIAIGHPHALTIAYLKYAIPRLALHHVALVPLQQLMRGTKPAS